jgi:hypothetical protein
MADPIEPIDERTAAQVALLGATRSVSEALPTFSTWLMAGFGAAFALILANIDKVSLLIDIRHIRFAVLLFLASVVIAVLSNYLSVVVKAGLSAQVEGELLARRLKANVQPFDIEYFSTEYKRGLFPPISWIAHSAMEKAKRGDIVASARMVAKISQIQTFLVVAQGLLAVVAASAIAFGMKLQ